MNTSALFISIMVGLSILGFAIVISALIYQSNNKNTRYKQNNPDDWLLYRFGDKVYNALFSNAYPEDVATKFGIDIDEYYKNCIIVGVEPDIKGLVVDYLYGLILFGFNLVLGFLIHPTFIFVGTVILYVFMMKKRSFVKSKATEMKNEVARDFPRFISMLSAELDVGMSIDIAISIISDKFDSLLSREFQKSLNNVKLGAYAWQDALYQIAEKYDLDMLSDFVMDITTAFNKGVNISDIVKTRVKDSKNKRLYIVKERAAKAENAILIPIALLQFIPLLVYILLPTLLSVRFL